MRIIIKRDENELKCDKFFYYLCLQLKKRIASGCTKKLFKESFRSFICLEMVAKQDASKTDYVRIVPSSLQLHSSPSSGLLGLKCISDCCLLYDYYSSKHFSINFYPTCSRSSYVAFVSKKEREKAQSIYAIPCRFIYCYFKRHTS
jgi:hypothetical protein